MAVRWRLRATRIEGGFALHLVGSGDLGKALGELEDTIVEMEDGSVLGLTDAVLSMLEGRTVAGFVVLTDPAACRRTRRLRSLARRVRQPREDLQNAPTGDSDEAPRRYTRAELEALPVLSIGQADDLRIEDQARGIRVWLSRGPPYVVEVERWQAGWITVDRYGVP